jgi:hypothetical protein
MAGIATLFNKLLLFAGYHYIADTPKVACPTFVRSTSSTKARQALAHSN